MVFMSINSTTETVENAFSRCLSHQQNQEVFIRYGSSKRVNRTKGCEIYSIEVKLKRIEIENDLIAK